MQFQTYGFMFLFLPLALSGWWLFQRAKKPAWAQGFLLACSLFFYGFLNSRFLPVILLSIAANFSLARLMAKFPSHKRLLLILALLLNLGALGYFKYSNFFIENLNALLQSSVPFITLFLPLGISFFTFQQIAYLVDVYRGDAPQYAPLDYALFVSFFPCVVSGPIALHDEVIPAFHRVRKRGFSSALFAQGLMSFSFGLSKKLLLADVFGRAADWGFGAVGLSSISALIVILSYTLQLYFDFSGYTDMARGLGLMLGIPLPQNFNAPYKALSIGQFWKGWHMTMTRFFTRYLYIPLGGSRGCEARTCLNIMIIFLASGLWHGASWTFVLWGALHGVAMVIDRLFGKQIARVHPALSWLLTFGFVNVCWVFFRATSIPSALGILRALFRFDLTLPPYALLSCFESPSTAFFVRLFALPESKVLLCVALFLSALSMLICLQGKTMDERLRAQPLGIRAALTSSILFFWGLISMTGVSSFLYANF